MESEENGTVLILPTPIPSSLWLRLRSDFRFSLGQKRSYNSDSVTSENQPLPMLEHLAKVLEYLEYFRLVNQLSVQISVRACKKNILWHLRLALIKHPLILWVFYATQSKPCIPYHPQNVYLTGNKGDNNSQTWIYSMKKWHTFSKKNTTKIRDAGTGTY